MLLKLQNANILDSYQIFLLKLQRFPSKPIFKIVIDLYPESVRDYFRPLIDTGEKGASAFGTSVF